MEFSTLFHLMISAILITSISAFNGSSAGCTFPAPLNPNYVRALIKDEPWEPTETDPGAFGAAHLLAQNSPNGPIAWPRRDSDGLNMITYCYARPDDRGTVHVAIEKAIQGWYDALGGHGGPDSEHGIAFDEARKSDGTPVYCYDEHYEWNPALSYDVLPIIYKGDYRNSWASVGLQRTNPPRAWVMLFIVGGNVDAAELTHEFGHVLGLGHEHQRPDRDDYVRYDCTQLWDYQTALWAAQSQNASITGDILCNSVDLQVQFGFSAQQYTKSREYHDDWYVRIANDSPYDFGSIMHLSTDRDGNWDCTHGRRSINECALTKWINGKTERQRINGWSGWRSISYNDAEAVKQIYRYYPTG